MKVLYSQSTQAIKPYPRQDDESVVGLDSDYLVLTKVEATLPSYDPGTQYLSESWLINIQSLEYQQSWEVKAIADPDWISFNTAMLSDSSWQSWAIPADLRSAIIAASINNNLVALESAYAIAKVAVPPTEEAIAGWQAIADLYNIPIVF